MMPRCSESTNLAKRCMFLKVHAKDESVRLLRVSEGEARAALEKLEKEVVGLRRRLEVAEEVRA